MITDAEKRFNEEYKIFRLLLFSGSKITVSKMKNWVRVKGQEVLKKVDKEIASKPVRNMFARQSEPEQDELHTIHEIDKDDD